MTEQKPADRRRVFGLALPELVAFVLYCCVQVWMCLVHEAWGDEAQAWLLARDSSLLDLFYRRLHYEGTPGLWHLLLWAETRLGVSYLGMHFISSAIAAIGVYLLLRFAPLPRWIKLLFPFGFAILYQGPIVARSYVLTLPLLAALCALRRSATQRPVAYAVLLGLLVNTSALGALLAIGVAAEWLLSAVRGRWRFPQAAVLKAITVTVLLWGAALYTVLPAPDAHFEFLGGLAGRPAVTRYLARLTGTTLQTTRGTPIPTSAGSASSLNHPPAYQVSRNRLQQKLYDLQFPDGKATISTHLLRNGLLTVAFALFVVSPSNLLALGFYAALALWLVKHRTLHFALPFLLLTTIGPKLYISAHHAMVWWFALLGLIWTAWPSDGNSSRTRRFDLVFCSILGVVLVQLVAFAVQALYFDSHYAFDGGEAAERYMTKAAPPGTVVAYTFFPTSMQPYSHVNLFANRPATYERWKQQDRAELGIDAVSAYDPRIVVVGETYSGTRGVDNQIIPMNVPGTLLEGGSERLYLTSHGFAETHRFCGDQPINFGTYEKVCQIFFEPVANSRR